MGADGVLASYLHPIHHKPFHVNADKSVWRTETDGFQADIRKLPFRKSSQFDSRMQSCSMYLADGDIAEGGGSLASGDHSAEGIEHTDGEGFMGDAAYPDVFKEYMLHKSATPAHGFQTNSLHGAGNFAVVGINISHAAGYGASDDQTTMAARHTAASDENVLAGTVYAPAVFIHAGIEGDAVVSGTKITVFNEYISAGIRIQAVRVGAFRMNMNVSDNDVFTVYRMKCPLRAVQNRNVFKKHAAAVDELEEGGAQGSSF